MSQNVDVWLSSISLFSPHHSGWYAYTYNAHSNNAVVWSVDCMGKVGF